MQWFVRSFIVKTQTGKYPVPLCLHKNVLVQYLRFFAAIHSKILHSVYSSRIFYNSFMCCVSVRPSVNLRLYYTICVCIKPIFPSIISYSTLKKNIRIYNWEEGRESALFPPGTAPQRPRHSHIFLSS